jgi:hypothetical protein
MKRPTNFQSFLDHKMCKSKLAGDFQFRVQPGETHSSNYVWILPEYELGLRSYVLRLHINWEENMMTIRMCKKGKNTEGENILTQPISVKNFKSYDIFVSYIEDIIEKVINLKLL